MFKKIGILLLVVIAVILALAASKPDSFRVERSLVMKATAAKVFAQFNDFHNWGAWSPWEKMDPAMKRTFSGAKSGKGAIYEWDGNDKVGAGRMEIVEATSPSKVVVKLDFLKPFVGHDMAEYSVVPEGAGSKVSWAMSGPNPFIAKVMQVFCSMDKLIGKDFESGLANMKAVVEK